MVAAVTSLPRVRFFIFHYESGLVLKIVFENRLFVAPFTQLLAVHTHPNPCSRRAGTPCSSLLPLTYSILFPLMCQYFRTALIRASANGRTAAVKLLLAAGADKDAKDNVREIERD